MKYQIEVKQFKDNEWRQYTVHSTYICAWFSAFKGRTWANFILWLNGSKKRVETRIVEVADEQ